MMSKIVNKLHSPCMLGQNLRNKEEEDLTESTDV